MSALSRRHIGLVAILTAPSIGLALALPVVIVYVFLQRHFIRGMVAGAVKG